MKYITLRPFSFGHEHYGKGLEVELTAAQAKPFLASWYLQAIKPEKPGAQDGQVKPAKGGNVAPTEKGGAQTEGNPQ